MSATNENTSLESRIPQEIVQVLEDYDIRIDYVEERTDGEYEIALTGYTDAGGEENHSLYVASLEDKDEIKAAFAKMESEWDPSYEASLWAECLDKTPFASLSDLLDDLEDYRTTLRSVTATLNGTLEQLIPQAVRYVLEDRANLAVRDGRMPYDDYYVFNLYGTTEGDNDVVIPVSNNFFFDVNGWLDAIILAVADWDPRKQAKRFVNEFDGDPRPDSQAVCDDFMAFKKNVLAKVCNELSFLADLEDGGYLA